MKTAIELVQAATDLGYRVVSVGTFSNLWSCPRCAALTDLHPGVALHEMWHNPTPDDPREPRPVPR